MAPSSNTHHRDLLQRCQTLLLDFCDTQNQSFISTAAEYLFAHADRSVDNESQRRFFEARQVITEHQQMLAETMQQSIRQRFKQCIQGTSPTSKAAPSSKTAAAQPLGLVENDTMELEVAFSSMHHRAEADCAEALYALAQRTAVLNGGVKLEEALSPYAPGLFCDALQLSLEKIGEHNTLEMPTQLILLKLFDRHFIRHLSVIYGSINDELIANDILPNLRYGEARKNTLQPRRRKSDALNAESENRQHELMSTIQELLHNTPTQLTPGMPVVPIETLLAELGSLQSEQLSSIQNLTAANAIPVAAPAPKLPHSNTKMSQHAINCVGVLFECILDDKRLPDSIKALLSHLHTPMLKVALLEPDFLNDTKHPARQLLNTLISAGEQWVAPDCTVRNDVLPRMQELVKRLIVEFKDDTGVFVDLLQEFTEYLIKLQQKAKIAEDRSLQAAKGKEELRERRNEVDATIRDKLGDEKLPRPVVELITGPWATFLAYILLRHGKDTQVWDDAVGVIDDTLWFIEPKIDDTERKLAAKMKISLYRRIEDGLTSVGRSSSDVQAAVHALEMCHALATDNLEALTGAAASDAPQNESAAQQPRTTDKVSATPTAEPPSGAKSLATVTDIQREKQAQSKPVSAIDNQRQKREDMDIPAPLIDRVLQMEFGTWLEWHEPNQPKRQLKLTWYNRNTQNCMLANQMGQQVAVVHAREIAAGIRDGWIQPSGDAAHKPFFEKMLEIVAEQLRTRSKTA